MSLLRATRAIIAFASTLHIAALKLTVRLADYRADKAWERADGVAFIVQSARRLVEQATEDHKRARAEGREASRVALATRRAALAEAQSLRPSFSDL